MSFAIKLHNVGVMRQDRWILRDVNWSVRRGACCAILGPNGAGKSTLTRILGGHLWPTTGDVTVLGRRFGEASLRELRQHVKLVQPAGPYDVDPELTCVEIVVTGFFSTLAMYNEPDDSMRHEALRLLEQVGLSHVAEHRYATLSSGERVRALIARALVAPPELLLLDEPTAGLDLLAREQVLATVERMFTPSASAAATRPPPATILVTHHVEELPPATQEVLLLSQGRPAALGPPEAVLTAPILSDVYGCPLDVRRTANRTFVHVHPAAWEGLLRGPTPPG